MVLAYVADVDIIERSIKEVIAAFPIIEKESRKTGLAENKDKIHLMVSARRASTRLDQSVNVYNRYNFKTVDAFIYIGSGVNLNNNVSLKFKRRILLAHER